MALREYLDRDGRAWRVWLVRPGSILGSDVTPLANHYRGGWLCFESDAEKRRLNPVPESWETRSPEELDLLRRAAELVRKVKP